MDEAAGRSGTAKGAGGTPYFVAVFAVLAFAIVLTGWFYFQRLTTEVHEARRRELATIADLKVAEIARWRRVHLADAERIADTSFVGARAAQWFRDGRPEGAAAERLRAWLSSFVRLYDYHSVALVDPSTFALLSVPDPGHPVGKPALDLVARSLAEDRVLLSDLHLGATPRLAAVPHLDLAVPLHEAPGGAPPCAALLFRLDPTRYLFPLIERWPTPSESAESLLVRREGDEVLFLNELRHRPGAALTLRRSSADRGLPAAQAVGGVVGSTEGVDYRGVPVLAAVQPVPDTTWFLVAKVDQREALAGTRQLGALVLLAVVALLSLAGVCVALVARRGQAAAWRAQYVAEHARLQAAERYAQLVRQAYDAILLVDDEGVVVEANDRAGETYGHAPGELRGVRFEALGGPSLVSGLPPGVTEVQHRRKDGSSFPVECSVAEVLLDGRRFRQLIVRDVTERVRAEERKTLLVEALEILNRPCGEVEAVREILALVKVRFGLEAVGLRLKQGDDYPYDEVSGFPETFVEAERSLYVRGPDGAAVRDAEGRPVLACLCGAVLAGSLRAGKDWATPGGSFWSGSSLELCRSLPEAERPTHGRYRCPELGYETLALVPLRAGREVVGLLHLADRRKHALTAEDVRFLEMLGASVGVALARRRADEALRRSERALEARNRVAQVLLTVPDDQMFEETLTVVRDVLASPAGAFAALGERDELHVRARSGLSEAGARALLAGTSRLSNEPTSESEGGRSLTRSMVVPLRSRGPVVGVLGVADREAPYEPADLRLLEDLAGFVAPVLHARLERSRLEEKMQHVQKLESLGVLAGGIAHDFNNLLMAVLGNADLALLELPPTASTREYLTEITKAAHRAADLCRQMLAYAGKGRFLVQPVDLSRLVEEMGHMLEVSVSKKALLRYHVCPGLPAVLADATQVRQIAMNLITNASDAIGEGSGVISVSTGAVDCDRAYLHGTWVDDELPEGQYVYLEVSDTGCGIAPDALPRIFDPFYTTKFTGSGLGLAAVLGIVRGHKGALEVRSEPGEGSSFKVLFPAAPGATEASGPEPGAAAPWRGAGTVLLVDDDESVRSVGRRMLERLGFAVVTAADGRSALELFTARPRDFACVLLDLTMPHMNGEEAFRELRRVDPAVRVLLSSGYDEQDVVQRFVGKGLAGFVHKPYRSEDLAARLRAVLGAPA